MTQASKLMKTVAGAVILGGVMLSSIATSQAEEKTDMTKQIIELVYFKLVPGADEAQFVKSSALATDFMTKQPGFVSRRLSKTSDGHFVDHVTWASLPEAENAMKASMTEASLVPFMQLIDPASVKVEHQELVAKVN